MGGCFEIKKIDTSGTYLSGILKGSPKINVQFSQDISQDINLKNTTIENEPNLKNSNQPEHSIKSNKEINKKEEKYTNNTEEINDLKKSEKSNSNQNKENYYKNFDINKDYYLICPSCNLYITNIESVEYDSNIGDFIFKYKCSCDIINERNIHLLLNEKKPICMTHNKEINYICIDA